MYDSNRTRPETSGQLSALSPDASWPEFMQQAALCFLGQPHKRYRGEWRYGSRSSLAVHVEGPRAGTWRDFEGDAGGGVLDFLQHFAGLDHDRAVAWLAGRPSPQARPTHQPHPCAGRGCQGPPRPGAVPVGCLKANSVQPRPSGPKVALQAQALAARAASTPIGGLDR